MKILDRYIIRKFLGTLLFMLGFLSVVVIIIDVQQKAPKIEESGFTIGYFLVHFYPFWMVYLTITFMSILIFVSVIFFTSKMANNTEIVSYVSSGKSFHRFARPYIIVAVFLALFALLINHMILPLSNVEKNKYEGYISAEPQESVLSSDSERILSRLSSDEYLFINWYDRQKNKGSEYLYQKFDNNQRLVYQVSAREVAWDVVRKKFVISNYSEKTILPDDTEILSNGSEKYEDFHASPAELFPSELEAQNKTTPELIKFIERERIKGNKNLTAYMNELYIRSTMPISIIILTVLALSLCSQKKRGGLGLNLAIGISLAFIFIFSFEMLKLSSVHRILPPLFAMWIPNLFFGPLALYLYFKRANM